MGERLFTLVASIRTTDTAAIQPVLTNLIPHGVITPTAEGFRVEAELEGTGARDLNRMLLSALRRIDRRATLHAGWTSEGTTEQFFDYTARGTRISPLPQADTRFPLRPTPLPPLRNIDQVFVKLTQVMPHCYFWLILTFRV